MNDKAMQGAVDLGALQVPQVPAAIMSWRTRTAMFVLPDGTKMPVLECEMGGTNNMTFNVAMPPEMLVPFAAEMLAWLSQLSGSAPQTPVPDMQTAREQVTRFDAREAAERDV